MEVKRSCEKVVIRVVRLLTCQLNMKTRKTIYLSRIPYQFLSVTKWFQINASYIYFLKLCNMNKLFTLPSQSLLQSRWTPWVAKPVLSRLHLVHIEEIWFRCSLSVLINNVNNFTHWLFFGVNDWSWINFTSSAKALLIAADEFCFCDSWLRFEMFY